MRLRATLVVALLLSLGSSGLLAIKWRQADRRADATARWTRFVMDSLGTTLELPPPPAEPWGRDSVYWQWVATTARLQSRRWQLAVQHWAQTRGSILDDSDTELLRQRGLTDPPRQLRDSLNAHPEIIPFAPVLGGTMFFDEIDVLQSPYVFANFEDGHINGSMLLEYEIESGAHIRWKRLWARLE
jgi:hypothetical protein